MILTVLYLIVTPIAVWIRNKTAEGLLKNDRSREKKITNGENRMDTLPCLMGGKVLKTAKMLILKHFSSL